MHLLPKLVRIAIMTFRYVIVHRRNSVHVTTGHLPRVLDLHSVVLAEINL